MLHPRGSSAGLFGPAIGSFHEAGASPRHDCKPHLAQAGAHLAGEGIVEVIRVKAGGAKNTDTGADKMERTKPQDKLPGNPENAPQFPRAGLRPFQEDALVEMRRCLWCTG